MVQEVILNLEVQGGIVWSQKSQLPTFKAPDAGAICVRKNLSLSDSVQTISNSQAGDNGGRGSPHFFLVSESKS